MPLLVVAACAGSEPVDLDPASPAPAASPSAAPATSPSAAPATALGMPAMVRADVASLDGVVGEVLQAGHYTYVRVGDDWAVVMGQLDTRPGEAISLRVQGSQTDFHSRRLDRDF